MAPRACSFLCETAWETGTVSGAPVAVVIAFQGSLRGSGAVRHCALSMIDQKN
jgi:hypothetical protein